MVVTSGWGGRLVKTRAALQHIGKLLWGTFGRDDYYIDAASYFPACGREYSSRISFNAFISC